MEANSDLETYSMLRLNFLQNLLMLRLNFFFLIKAISETYRSNIVFQKFSKEYEYPLKVQQQIWPLDYHSWEGQHFYGEGFFCFSKQMQKMKTESTVTWESGCVAEDTLGCVLLAGNPFKP